MTRILSLLTSLILGLLILITLLIATPFGSHGTVWLLDKTLPFLQLSYESGQLNRKISLRDFELKLSVVEVRFDHATLDWNPRCLLKGELCGDSLQATNLEVAVSLPEQDDDTEQQTDSKATDIANSAAESETEANHGIPLPFIIDFKQVELQHTKVTVDQMTFSADRIDSKLRFSPTELRLSHPDIEQLLVSIPSRSDDNDTPAKSTNDSPAASEPGSEQGPLADLPQVELPFAIEINAANIVAATIITGPLQQQLHSAQFNGHWRGTTLDLQQLTLDHQWAQLSGDYQMRFEPEFPVKARIHGQLQQLPWAKELAGLTLSGTLSHSLAKPDIDVELQGPWQGKLQGQLDLTQAALPYQAKLTKGKLQWPLTQPQYRADNITLNSQGDLDSQRFEVDAELDLEQWPRSKVSASGQHHQQRFTLSQLAIDGSLGVAQANGMVDLSDGIKWQAAIDAEQLDLAKLDPRLALAINGNANTQGHYRDNQDWHVQLQQADLSGQWQQLPLLVKGDLVLNSQWQLQAKQLQLQLNGTQLEANGGLNDGQWQLAGQLRSPQLSQWLSDLQGNVQASFAISGSEQQPQIDFKLTGRKLGFQQWQLAEATLNGSYQPLQQHRFSGQLNTSALTIHNQSLSRIAATLKGDIANQQLGIRLNGPIEGELEAQGQLSDNQQHWQGQLTQLSVNYDDWWLKLNQATSIDADIAKQEAIVGQHCWLSRGTQACSTGPSLVGQRGAMLWNLDLTLEQLLKPILPSRMRLSQQIEGQLALNWSPEQDPMLTAKIVDDGGELALERGFGLADAQFAWQRSELTVNLQRQRLQLSSDVDVDPQRSLELSADIITNGDYPISGSLQSQRLQLAPILAWIPQLADAQLQLDGNLAIGGSLKKPQLNGQLQLSDGLLRTLINPTSLTDLQLQLDFAGDTAAFNGSSAVGDGLATLNGKLYWQQILALEAKINGQQLDVLYPPLLQAKASPALNLIWAPNLLSITGNINVDSGKLSVQSLPKGAVSVSDDVVYINNTQDTTVAEQQRTTLDLQIALAPALEIEALGVTGVMGGDLQLRQLPTQPIQVYGSLKLQDGQFEAYGQRLAIARGNLIFNGPPEVPNIDVEAQRQIDSEDLTVGVRLTGVPQQPKLTLFADRTMEQQEILSYLIRGQGLNADGDSSLWAAAALSVGVGTTGGLVTAIGEELGLRQVKLDAEGTGDQTQITVSGYIGERLFVKYGVEVFGQGLSELTVRYYLMQKLWLEAVSAVSQEDDNQSLDIYYLFEID